MARKKISRNDPCPCGSGKKFKHCCYGKHIDWNDEEDQPGEPSSENARQMAELAGLTPFGIVDGKLKTLAQSSPGPATWQTLVASLSKKTSTADRLRTYQAVREAGGYAGGREFVPPGLDAAMERGITRAGRG